MSTKELGYGGSSNKNGEGIPCCRTADVEGAVTKPDAMGLRDQEHDERRGDRYIVVVLASVDERYFDES